MPADIQVNIAQNGVSEYCFLRETCRGSSQLSLALRQIPAQMISRLQTFCLSTGLLVSEHSQVSEINAGEMRKLWVKKYLASAEQQKQQENRPLSRNAETKDFARLTSHPV